MTYTSIAGCCWMSTTAEATIPHGPNRLPLLDGLRFLAALWVFLFHFGGNSSFWQTGPLKYLSDTGAWGVSFFFMLSGFVLMRSYGPTFMTSFTFRTVVSFWILRLLRLAPVYYGILFLFLLLYGIVLSEPVPTDELLLHLAMLQAWFPDKALSLNFPAWSLSCEIFYYLLFPVLCLFLAGLKRMIGDAAIPVALLLTPLMALADLHGFLGMYHPVTNLPLFVCGMLLGLIPVKRMNLGLGLVLWMMLLLVVPHGQYPRLFVNGYSAAPVFALIIVVASKQFSIYHVINKFLRIVGQWSYPFYLGQYFSALLTKYIYWQFLERLISGYDIRHIFWLNILVSILFVQGVEKPFEKFRYSVKRRFNFMEF